MKPLEPDRVRINLGVNGEPVSEEVEARQLLSDFLRHRLGLTGTHVGCEQGVCGACTVSLDGAAVRSCLIFAAQADGCEIETVESLAGPEDELTPLQAAFHRHHALQCGFCTAGFLVSLSAREAQLGSLAGQDYRSLLSGNLCRCTGYANIVAAVRERAEGPLPVPADLPAEAWAGKMTGRSVARLEDRPLLTGRATFVDDLEPPGTLHLAFHRTERAHARIQSVDCERARSVPGVTAVLGHQDLDGPRQLTPPIEREGVFSPPRPLLAGERVRFVGEAVALALADSRYAAEDACDLVEVEYLDLPGVPDMMASLAADSAQIHEPHPNVLLDEQMESGDVTAALAAAPVLVDATFDVSRVSPFPLEGRAVLAVPEEGRVTVWTSTQAPHQVKRALAEILDASVNVICPSVGGGFGQKSHVYPEEILVPWLALKYGRPVKWVEDRRENLLASGHARGQLIRARAAADSEGRLLAVDADILADMGAYGIYPHGHILEALGTPNLIPGPYALPSFRFRTRAVATNRSPGGAYRGVGVAAAVFVHERLMDSLAEATGIDAAEIRRRNLVPPTSLPYTNSAGVEYDSGDYPAALVKVKELIGYDRMEERRRGAADRGRLLGCGLACYVEPTGMGSEVFKKRGMVGIAGYDDAHLAIDQGGVATLSISLPSAGQGLATSFAQLLADELGLPLSSVCVAGVETDAVADGTGTFGSRSAAVGGALIMQVAKSVKAAGFKLAAAALEASEGSLEARPGGVGVIGSETAFLSYASLAELAPGRLLEARERYDPVATTFSYGAHACVVEVDPTTGGVQVVEHVVVEDCGPMINPMLVEGQTHGAVAQGLGAGLLEAVRYGADGQPLTASMMDYLLPTAVDLPDFKVLHLERASPHPGGYKGVAEGGTVAAPAALANAVSNAVGAQINSIPITPEVVMAALAGRRLSNRSSEED